MRFNDISNNDSIDMNPFSIPISNDSSKASSKGVIVKNESFLLETQALAQTLSSEAPIKSNPSNSIVFRTEVPMRDKNVANINLFYKTIFNLWILLTKKELSSENTEQLEIVTNINEQLKKIETLVLSNNLPIEVLANSNILKIAIYLNNQSLINQLLSRISKENQNEISAFFDLESAKMTPFEFSLLRTSSLQEQKLKWNLKGEQKNNFQEKIKLISLELLEEIKPSFLYIPEQSEKESFSKIEEELSIQINQSIKKINDSLNPDIINKKIDNFKSFFEKISKISTIVSSILTTTSPLFKLVSITLTEPIALIASISSYSKTLSTVSSIAADALPIFQKNKSFSSLSFIKEQLDTATVNNDSSLHFWDENDTHSLLILKSIFNIEHQLILPKLKSFIESEITRLENSLNTNLLSKSKLEKLTSILNKLQDYKISGIVEKDLLEITILEKELTAILNLSRTAHNQITLLLLRLTEYLGFSKTTGMHSYKQFKDQNKLMFSSLEHGVSALKVHNTQNKKHKS